MVRRSYYCYVFVIDLIREEKSDLRCDVGLVRNLGAEISTYCLWSSLCKTIRDQQRINGLVRQHLASVLANSILRLSQRSCQ